MSVTKVIEEKIAILESVTDKLRYRQATKDAIEDDIPICVVKDQTIEYCNKTLKQIVGKCVKGQPLASICYDKDEYSKVYNKLQSGQPVSNETLTLRKGTEPLSCKVHCSKNNGSDKISYLFIPLADRGT